jgi:hypothetical protein
MKSPLSGHYTGPVCVFPRYFACRASFNQAGAVSPGLTDIRGLLDNLQINGNSFCFQATYVVKPPLTVVAA